MRAFNLLLRANSDQFQVLCARLRMASVADLALHARLERRLADGKAGWRKAGRPIPPLTDPTALPAQLEARRLAKEGYPTLAHFHWKAACDATPEDRDLALGYANTLHGTAGPKVALTALQDLCRRYPDFLAARQALAGQLVRMSSYSQAVAVCDAILAEHPKSVPALAARGESLRHLRRTDAAVSDLRRITEIVPAQPFHRIKLANLLLSLGQYDQVMALGKEVPIGGPWTDFNVIVARAHIRGGDATGADLLFATLAKAEPGNPRIGAAWLQEDLAADRASHVKARVIAFVRQFPDDMAGYGLVLTCLQHLPADPDLWTLLNDAPLRLRQTNDFQLTILQEACQREGRAAACDEIIKVQNRDNLSAEAGLSLVNALWSRRETEAAYGRLNELLGRFPKHLNVLRTCIMVFGARSPDAMRKVKAELLKRLSPLERCDLLSGLPPEILTEADRAVMTDRVS